MGHAGDYENIELSNDAPPCELVSLSHIDASKIANIAAVRSRSVSLGLGKKVMMRGLISSLPSSYQT